MTRLLTDEELRQRLQDIWDTHTTPQGINAIVELIQSQKLAHADMVIGEDIKPMMGGKEIARGKTVTIDLENNMKESLIFIEDNSKYNLQQVQRERNK